MRCVHCPPETCNDRRGATLSATVPSQLLLIASRCHHPTSTIDSINVPQPKWQPEHGQNPRRHERQKEKDWMYMYELDCGQSRVQPQNFPIVKRIVLTLGILPGVGKNQWDRCDPQKWKERQGRQVDPRSDRPCLQALASL